ncbi:MFS transporter [Nigerium massiliense]|uniref:MFS transporter n=1 Tax=Nigerium massiliense TaxID=1522317 RepID=UPI00058E7025|nr:MFS transporter [Nigerium massiliense]
MASVPAPETGGGRETAPAVTAPHRWRALGALAAGLAMIVLDGTIVGVALPTIIRDLRLGLNQAQWVNALYSMIFAALLLASGRISDRIGRRRQFIAGVAVFALGSLLAGLASGAGLLIAARAVQGVGGAMVLPTTISTVNATFRGRDRAAAFGVWGAVMSGSAAIGPLLGGVLTTWASWPWIFFVNVPVAVLVIAAALAWVPESRGRDDRAGYDVLGLLLSAAGMGLIVFGLIEGSQLGWWTPREDLVAGPFVWTATAPVSAAPVALILGAVLFALFLGWEARTARRGRAVILDLALFSVPTFSWGVVAAAMVAVGEFGLVFVMPLYLVFVTGLDPMGAGLVLAAMAIGAFLSGAAARHVAARFGAPRTVVLGLALEVVGTAFTALVLGPGTSPTLVAATMAVYGFGLGLASAQLTSTVMVGVPVEQSGSASATQSTVRQVGSALGTALAGTALAVGLAARVPARVAAVSGLDPEAAREVVGGTIGSAGGLIPALRAQGAAGPFGVRTPEVVDALARGFSDAASGSLWVATAFLALGLLASFRVAAAAKALPGD